MRRGDLISYQDVFDALDARDRELAAMALARAWALSGPVLGHVHARTRAVRDLRERHRLA